MAPISEKVLAREFKRGDMIDVRMEEGELTFLHGEPHRRRDTMVGHGR